MCAVLAGGGVGFAQTPPRSAIEWLNQPPQPLAAGPGVRRPVARGERRGGEEPPVAQSGSAPHVNVTPLEAASLDSAGLLPASVTGLPVGLWRTSSGIVLSEQMAQLHSTMPPALTRLARTLVLSEADPPRGAGGFLEARLRFLMRIGALEEAQALAEQVTSNTPGLRAARFDLALLLGLEHEICGEIAKAPALAPDQAARVYCLALGGDWRSASLVYITAQGLGELSAVDAALLARFLDDEESDPLASLPPPRAPTVLQFRLLAAVGEPMTTRSLGREFAVADLASTSGWKKRLEAAERLAQSGVLEPGRLFAIYSEGAPAASGGVWERVDAVQRFEIALRARDPVALSSTLPLAYGHMREVGLSEPFARYYGAGIPMGRLSDEAARVAWRVALLGDGYEMAARRALAPGARAVAARDGELAFLVSVALGEPASAAARSGLERAVVEGFSAPPASRSAAYLENGELGAALLDAIALADAGYHGDAAALRDGLAMLRSAGLEDEARRAALQILLTRARFK